MQYSDNARKQITEVCEGLRLTAYPDPGSGGAPWTLGYGHTMYVSEGDTCTVEQADAWLIADIARAENIVIRCVRGSLTQNQFDALVDFAFNVGAGNFQASTLLKKINASDYIGACGEFKRWVYAAGKPLPGLAVRRAMEANWFETGTVDGQAK